jgi:hypothetical protein
LERIMPHRKLARAVLVLACVVPLLSAQTVARADVISAEQFLSAVDRRATLDSVNKALAREEVQRALKHYGVDPSDAAARVAALNDQELMLLAGDLEELPAGGLLGTVGLAAIVILILELVGVIDIFKKI